MNRFIRFEYNNKKLQPIDNFKDKSILSIDVALQSVLSIVDRLDHYIEDAKHSRHYPSDHGLTEDEAVAIYLYTNDWNGQSLNRVLNSALQSESQTALKSWLSFLKLFNAALRKLPTVHNTLWRGLPFDVVEKLNENEDLILCSIISCSSSSTIIEHLLDDKSIICSVKSFSGKNIQGYTAKNEEDEVLLLPGTRLRVKRKQLNNEQDKPIIYLEEINEVEIHDMNNSLNEEDISEFLISSSIFICNFYNFDIGDVQRSQTTPSISTKMINSEAILSKSDYKIIVGTTNIKSFSDKTKSKETMIHAVITFSNGDRYEIAYRNDKKHGYGKFYCIDGNVFDGPNADQKANGDGICVFETGSRFIGTYKNGNRYGHGILLCENGAIQACDWVDDVRKGQSLQIQSTGGLYEWKDEMGKGRWYRAYDDEYGNKYIGNIVYDKAHGLGIRIWPNNTRYEGNFIDDKKHGYGVYFYTDRDRYMGEWYNDETSGKGLLIWSNGTYYQGEFINGKKHGYGKIIFANGQIQEGVWRSDDLDDNIEAQETLTEIDFGEYINPFICGTIVTNTSTTSDFVSRFFAPWLGILEGPVRGSAHTVLTVYWSRILNNKSVLHAYQKSSRVGYVDCELDEINQRVLLRGSAIIIMHGQLFLKQYQLNFLKK
ncbi:unnamed protein product [Rotaria socialis]|uniref:NAD(P)(+)--arginine ADP-ribosyltransferase n=1 Tax=Rotaria socialis TaxID=392032 RepID=A0A818XBX1_9BILA|nr:unnamed protein product [Rotaria socialis]